MAPQVGLILAAALLCPAAWAGAPAAAGLPRSVLVSFETDPRVELLAVVNMLADPPAFERQFGGALPEHARRARAAFAPFASHPAVAHLRGLLKSGNRIAAAQLLLPCSSPPELIVSGSGEADTEEHTKEKDAFLMELRRFAERSGFMHFYEGNSEY